MSTEATVPAPTVIEELNATLGRQYGVHGQQQNTSQALVLHSSAARQETESAEYAGGVLSDVGSIYPFPPRSLGPLAPYPPRGGELGQVTGARARIDVSMRSWCRRLWDTRNAPGELLYAGGEDGGYDAQYAYSGYGNANGFATTSFGDTRNDSIFRYPGSGDYRHIDGGRLERFGHAYGSGWPPVHFQRSEEAPPVDIAYLQLAFTHPVLEQRPTGSPRVIEQEHLRSVHTMEGSKRHPQLSPTTEPSNSTPDLQLWPSGNFGTTSEHASSALTPSKALQEDAFGSNDLSKPQGKPMREYTRQAQGFQTKNKRRGRLRKPKPASTNAAAWKDLAPVIPSHTLHQQTTSETYRRYNPYNAPNAQRAPIQVPSQSSLPMHTMNKTASRPVVHPAALQSAQHSRRVALPTASPSNAWGNFQTFIQQDDKAKGVQHRQESERSGAGVFRPELRETYKARNGRKEIAIYEKIGKVEKTGKTVSIETIEVTGRTEKIETIETEKEGAKELRANTENLATEVAKDEESGVTLELGEFKQDVEDT